jgi:carbonic anhydrase
VAGSKLVVVLGHTSCGAVNAAVDLLCSQKSQRGHWLRQSRRTRHGDPAVHRPATCKQPNQWLPGEKAAYSNEVSRRNVIRTIQVIRERSTALDKLVRGRQDRHRRCSL